MRKEGPSGMKILNYNSGEVFHMRFYFFLNAFNLLENIRLKWKQYHHCVLQHSPSNKIILLSSSRLDLPYVSMFPS